MIECPIALGNSDICGNQYLGGSSFISGSETVTGTITAVTGGIVATTNNITCASGNFVSLGLGDVDNAGNLVVSRQIRSSTVSTYSQLGSAGTVTILPRQGQVHKVTFNVGTTIINVAQADAIALPGAVVYIIVTNTAGTNQVIDFNSYFKTTNLGIKTIVANTTSTFAFVSGGDYFYEIGEAIIVAP